MNVALYQEVQATRWLSILESCVFLNRRLACDFTCAVNSAG